VRLRILEKLHDSNELDKGGRGRYEERTERESHSLSTVSKKDCVERANKESVN